MEVWSIASFEGCAPECLRLFGMGNQIRKRESYSTKKGSLCPNSLSLPQAGKVPSLSAARFWMLQNISRLNDCTKV